MDGARAAPGVTLTCRWSERIERALTWANQRYQRCDICAARCDVDRHHGGRGRCGLGADAHVYKEYLHLGEEQRLIPSHTIFMTGCNMGCRFCTDLAQVKHPLEHGVVVAPQDLAERIAQRRDEGAKNVQFVGGVPDVNLLYILRVLSYCPPDTSVVWNTNLWTTAEAIAHLRGIVTTWLTDLKFGNDVCGKALGRVEGYTGTVHSQFKQLRGADDVIVRHLLMPGHLECCTKPALDFLRREHPGVGLNLMTGYLPMDLAGSRGPMGGALNRDEVDAALAIAKHLGFRDLMLDGRRHADSLTG